MTIKKKLMVCALAATMTAGCTVEEMQSFALGATVALVAASAAQDNGHSNAYGPTSCGPGETLEVGYDEYDNPVRFCVYDGPYMNQEQIDALGAQAQ